MVFVLNRYVLILFFGCVVGTTYIGIRIIVVGGVV